MIRAGIRQGLVGASEQLVEGDLVKSYATSRNAVREAMGLLADEGLVTRTPRYGTVVVGSIARVSLITGQAWWEDGDKETFESVRLDSIALPMTTMLRTLLDSAAASVNLIEWLLRRDGAPFCVYTNYWTGGSTPRRPINEHSTDDFSELFEDYYGVGLGTIDLNVEAVMCDARMAKVLDLEPGEPVLFRERLLTDTDGVPREYSHAYWPGTKVSLHLSTRAHGTPC
jgi:GntR family transcriptional regulator